MKKKAYRAKSVKEINVTELVLGLAEGPVWAGLDVGKGHTMTVIRDSQGSFQRPWKVLQPEGIGVLRDRLKELSLHRPLVVAMEPTGTYGDPLRQALCDAGLEVHWVSPKATSDYAEVFDGVPSQHDGKDAAVVADLSAIGKSRPWPFCPDAYGAMRFEVQWLDAQQDILQLWLGRLEALLARYWPELTGLLELNSPTLLRILAEYGSPLALAADPEAGAQLARWGGRYLKPEKIAAVLACAEETVGVRMEQPDRNLLQRYARAAQESRQKIQEAQSSLEQMAAGNEMVTRIGQAVGMVTACVLLTTVGDPRDYSCGEAYRKALGLNLTERSSGKHQGQLKISKRGPSTARRWLYLAALRQIRQPEVKPWYERKKEKDQQRGGKGVVAIMRKLALAIYAVAKGKTFDPGRLFPGRNIAAKAEANQPGSPAGVLPPDPRNLALSGQDRIVNENAAASP